MRTFVIALALAAAGTLPALGQPAQRCAKDDFSVNGHPVTVKACAPAVDAGKTVTVDQAFTSGGSSVSQPVKIDVLPGVATSRAINDVSLAPLGLSYTMHVTLAYRGGAVAIEHVLLLPGAVPLK